MKQAGRVGAESNIGAPKVVLRPILHINALSPQLHQLLRPRLSQHLLLPQRRVFPLPLHPHLIRAMMGLTDVIRPAAMKLKAPALALVITLLLDLSNLSTADLQQVASTEVSFFTTIEALTASGHQAWLR